MNAEVLSIGNEVLSGRTLDTNFQFLARLLEGAGARLVGHQALPDDAAAIARGLALALARADLVVCTGGLGPTPDDLTVDAVARALGRAVVRDEAIVQALRARWRQWSARPMPANNEQQALLPAGATAWVNPVGSAPGIQLEHDGHDIVLLPGVPEEMRALAEQRLAPFVRSRTDQAVEYVTVRTVGIAESVLAERLAGLAEALPGAWVAYLPGLGAVDVRIALPAGADAAARAALGARARALVHERAGEFVFAADERALEEVVGALLLERRWRVAVAESCTAGLLGARITNVPGSSRWFEGGLLVYANAAKVALAGVSPDLLAAHGAVSAEAALALARGAVTRLGTECGLGVTGIAGPDGGSPAKPVGTVHVAAVSPDGELARHLLLRGTRAQVRERAVTLALDLLRRRLLGLPATAPGALGAPPAPPPAGAPSR